MIHGVRATMAMCALLLAGMAAAQPVYIDVYGSGGATKVGIAVPPLVAAGAGQAQVASEMTGAMRYDLDFCGLFNVLPDTAFPVTFKGFPADATAINLEEWKGSGAEYVVYGLVSDAGGMLVVQFRLYSVASGQQELGRQVTVPANRPRLAPHRFSEDVIEAIDGKPGIATTELVFSTGQTGNKEIFVADYDGANLRRVTEHKSISIRPRFSADCRKIAYVSYRERYPYIYVFDRDSGQSRRLSSEPGVNMSPSWSPDGSWLALTLSKDTNTEIYRRNADGSSLKRLTNNRNGDTSPAVSPDGSRIAYVSDRGSPQLYVMGAGGGEGSRVSFQGGNSYDPAWSPDGTKLAYAVERRGAGVQIFVCNADGSGAQQVTSSGGAKESPSWSPDGRHVVYMSNGGGNGLWTVTLSTLEERPVPKISQRCEGPNWGKARMR